MHSLDTAIAVISKWPAGKQKERDAARAALAGLIGDCEAAIKVWQGYLAAPTTSPDKWSIVAWIGAERGKQLYEINLAARQRLHAVCASAGGAAARSVLLDDDLIEMAYRMLAPGETGVDAANSAAQKLQEQIAHLRALLARLSAAPSTAKVGAALAKRPTKPGKPKAVRKKAATKRKTAPKPKAGKKPKKRAARPKK
jgi:hypothetical protein